MKGYRNYNVTLEHVTDSNIDSVEYVKCKTEKEARRVMVKMSKSKKAQQLKTTKNNWGELPNLVRVYASSTEEDNDDFVQGVHILMYEDGVCTHSSVG